MDKDKLAAVLDDIFDNFDFEKVKKTMDALNWTWWVWIDPKVGTLDNEGKRVPTLDEIKKVAANLLWECANMNEDVIATGGFRVEKDFSDPENPWMRLSFEVTDWDACTYETDDDF